jgi:acetyl esterase/lipase
MFMPLLAATVMMTADEIRLWPGDAPGALGKAAKDVPTLTPFLPANPSGAAVVVCPGGGYGMLAGHEGKDYALWLNRLGVTVYVLKYRLGSDGYRHPSMLFDAARAIRTVRARAKEWGIDPKKIGIMGSSAGGHLASTAVTHFDSGNANSSDPIEKASSRPDFGILCYAVISMGPVGHSGSKENLLGKNPDPKLVEDLSNELRVTAQTPPCFVWSTADDPVVPVENSLLFVEACRKFKVPVELHVYESGPHGIGLTGPPDSDKLHPWTHELARWLRSHDWAGK